MSTERSKDYLRGFGIPFSFTPADILTGSVSVSTFTTANPVADIPIPDRPSDLFVGATGGGDIASDLQVLTSKAGSASSAEYTIKDNRDSTTVVYGNQQDSFITGWLNLKARSATIEYFQHDIIYDDDGGYIVVYEELRSPNILRIGCTAVDAQGNVSNSTIATLGYAATFGSYGKPSLVKLADGSYLCIAVVVEDDKADVNVYRSIDGSTFTLASKQALDESINVSTGQYRINRASAAALHGQILLVFSADSASASYTKKNHVLQYASVDGGGSFKFITESSQLDTNSFKSCCVYTTHNQLAMCYVGATNELHNMLFPHAFFSAYSLRSAGKYIKINGGGSANDFASGTNDNMTSGWISGHQNPNSSFIVYARDVSDNAIVAFYSADSRNWYSLLTNGSPTTQANVFCVDNVDGIDQFVSAPYNGGSILVHNWEKSNHGESVGILYLGGFCTFTNPYRTNYYSDLNPLARAGTTFTYLPMLLPSDSNQLSASGTGTETLESAYVALKVTSAQADKLYTRTGTLNPTYRKGLTVFAAVDVQDSRSDTVPAVVELEVEVSGADYWKMRIEIYESNFEVFDTTQIVPISLLNQATDVSVAIDFMISIWDGKASFYWRYKGYDSLLRFNEGFKDTSLATSLTGSTTQNKVIFGVEGTPASGQSEARFYKLLVSDADAVRNMTNLLTADLIGKRFSTVQPQYISDGIGIFAQAGATYIGDEWNIKSTSNTSIDNTFYDISPSPRVQWHSASVAAGTDIPSQRIAYQVSVNATDLGNDLIALHLANLNFKDAILRYWDGVSWISVFTFETSSGLKHGYTKQGRSIKQNIGSVFDDNYYFHNELKDYIAMCTAGESTEFFRVVSNTEGGFGNATGKLCSVLLDGEPSTNGTVFFIPTNCTVVVNLNGIDSSRWALEFPAQKTIDNQLRLGNLILGPVAITGTQYSKGRKISIEAGNISTTTPDKTRYSKAFSPDQRTVSISWSDGVDISAFYDADPDPDYYKASSTAGAEAVSALNDVPYLMEGILRELQGSQKPLVYLPSITTSSDNRVYNRRDQHLLAVIDGEINIESITGEELVGNGKGEVMRVGTINLVEIV